MGRSRPAMRSTPSADTERESPEGSPTFACVRWNVISGFCSALSALSRFLSRFEPFFECIVASGTPRSRPLRPPPRNQASSAATSFGSADEASRRSLTVGCVVRLSHSCTFDPPSIQSVLPGPSRTAAGADAGAWLEAGTAAHASASTTRSARDLELAACSGLLIRVLLHHQDAAVSVRDHVAGDAPEEQLGEPRAAVGAEHDQVDPLVLDQPEKGLARVAGGGARLRDHARGAQLLLDLGNQRLRLRHLLRAHLHHERYPGVDARHGGR